MDQDTSSATTITFLGLCARLILWLIVLLLILDNLGVNITGLVAGLGIGGIAVALAVQNILGDLLASLSIVLDKPFVIGDFVVVDSLSGTIEHVGLKTTRIRSLSGEQLIFSNNDLLKSRIRNYKRMQERRIVFSFGVVYQTPLEKLKIIKKIVTDIITAQENARLDRVHFKEYGDSSLNFEIVYFIAKPDFGLYMDVQEAINLEIFRRFQEESIEFAYPTQTLYIQKDATEIVETIRSILFHNEGHDQREHGVGFRHGARHQRVGDRVFAVQNIADAGGANDSLKPGAEKHGNPKDRRPPGDGVRIGIEAVHVGK